MVIVDVLNSFKTDEEVKPIKWLIDHLENKYGAVFVGNKAKAEEVGYADEWSDEWGGFWVIAKTNYYSLVGPGELEEIMDDVIAEDSYENYI